jgi:hypothetical protein
MRLAELLGNQDGPFEEIVVSTGTEVSAEVGI